MAETLTVAVPQTAEKAADEAVPMSALGCDEEDALPQADTETATANLIVKPHQNKDDCAPTDIEKQQSVEVEES